MKDPLHPTAARIFAFLERRIKDIGVCPSYDEIALGADVAKSRISDHLDTLAARNLIRRSENRKRSIELVRVKRADPDDLRECLLRLKIECEVAGLGDRLGFATWLALANRLLDSEPRVSV